MADKWIQLMSEDGTDNLFPTSKMDLLWENASPANTAFNAQTLTIDLSNYKYIVIRYILDNRTNQAKPVAPLGIYLKENHKAVMDGVSNDSSSALNYSRNITISDTGIIFENGYRTTTVYANFCVPLCIYGIK